MDRKWWATWKFLNLYLWMIFFLLLTSSHVQAQEDIYDCNLDIIKDHPVPVCIQRFEQKLASLNQSQIKQGEDEFKRLEKENHIMDSIYYYSLFKSYPHPKVLFGQLMLGIKFTKSSPNDELGECEECGYILRQNYHYLTEYRILIGMLENKKQRDATEQNMLTQSQYYAQCLRSVLDDLEHNPDKIITNKEVAEQCYADSF